MKTQQYEDVFALLAAELRQDAATVRALTGDSASVAFAYERAADKVEAAAVMQASRTLKVKEAASLFQRHRDTIGKAIRDGRLTNYGSDTRPLVRFGELQKLFGTQPVANFAPATYDETTDARSRANARRGDVP